MNKGKLLQLVIGALAILMLCAGTALAKEKVRLAYVEWACATASTYVAQAVLQEKMGYDVEALPVSGAAMWSAMATGDVDAMVTAWLPVTHAEYLEKVKGNVEELGVVADGAKTGLVVPSYVTINSIEELNENSAKFDGKIIGIDPGAGMMGQTEDVIKEYGLTQIELIEGSGATMTAALQNAIRNNKWIVVTGWSPHWKFSRWELKYLEDPKIIYGEEEYIASYARLGLKQDMPEVYNFLKNFNWTQEQMGTVMGWNAEDGADPYENAKRFIKENEDLVNSWLQ